MHSREWQRSEAIQNTQQSLQWLISPGRNLHFRNESKCEAVKYIHIYTNMIKSKSRKHLGNLSYWNESKYCNSEVSKQALAKKQESMPLHRKYINKANDKIWFMFVCFFKLRGCNIRNVSAALTALMKVFPWFPCTFQKFYTLTLFWQMQILNIIPILSRLFSIYNNHLIVHNTKKAIHFILHKRIRRLKRNQTVRQSGCTSCVHLDQPLLFPYRLIV